MGKQSVQGGVRQCSEDPCQEPGRWRERAGSAPRGGFAPASTRAPGPMRQGFLDCIKETLGATDAEWKVVEPQLAKVMALSRETGARPRGSAGSPRPDSPRPELVEGRPGFDAGGPPGGGPDMGHGPEMRGRRPMSELAKAIEDLETTLEDPQATAAEIKARLKVLREVRWRGKRQLSEAKAVLLGLVAPRHEAQLVLMGIVD